MPYSAILDTYQPSRPYPESQQSDGVQGRPWKLSDFFKFGVCGDASSSIVDTYQPSRPYPVSQQSDGVQPLEAQRFFQIWSLRRCLIQPL